METCVNGYPSYGSGFILYNSYIFHTRVQHPEESFIEFLNQVVELASYCDFEAKNRMIRDQIIVGMRDENLRKKLFNLGNPTLDDLIEYLKTIEIHSDSSTERNCNQNESSGYSEEMFNCEEQPWGGSSNRNNQVPNNVDVQFEKSNEKLINNEVESSVGPEERDEGILEVENENVELHPCKIELNEDYDMNETEISELSKALGEECTVPISTSESDFSHATEEDPLEDKSGRCSSTLGILHSYIIKKEALEKNENESKGIESTAVGSWDTASNNQTIASSGDRDEQSEKRLTRNRSIWEGNDNDNSNDDIIEILEPKEKEEESEKNSIHSIIEEKIVESPMKINNALNAAKPKRENRKVIDIIEIDDSDEENVEEPSDSKIENEIKNIEKPIEKEIKNIEKPIEHEIKNIEKLIEREIKNIEEPKENVIIKPVLRSQSTLNITAHSITSFKNNNLSQENQIELKLEKGEIFDSDISTKENSEESSFSFGESFKSSSSFSKTDSSKNVSSSELLNQLDNSIFECKKCRVRFQRFYNLKRHLLNKHNDDRPFKCSKCSRSFRRESNFHFHLAKHFEDEDNSDHNEYSKTTTQEQNDSNGKNPNKGANSEKKSNGTQRKVSSREKFKCLECNQSFTRNAHLIRHLSTIRHKSEKAFKCDQCDKSFSLAHTLKVHKLIHLNEKPFKCNQCPQTFRQISNLNVHLTMHSGTRPFQCNNCLKTFLCKSHLINHLKIHSGEKYCKCKVCGKKLPSKERLRHHLIQHINNVKKSL